MEWVTQLADAIAWPLAAVVIAYLFRHRIEELAKRLATFETQKWKATFAKAADETRKELELSPKTLPAFPADELKVEDIYDPKAEIAAGWGNVEELCRQLLSKGGVPVPGPFRALGSRLKKNGLIDERHARILDKLRQMRNMAAHGQSEMVTAIEAREFIALTDQMTAYLEHRLTELTEKPD